jgi:hypothetical protein
MSEIPSLLDFALQSEMIREHPRGPEYLVWEWEASTKLKFRQLERDVGLSFQYVAVSSAPAKRQDEIQNSALGRLGVPNLSRRHHPILHLPAAPPSELASDITREVN